MALPYNPLPLAYILPRPTTIVDPVAPIEPTPSAIELDNLHVEATYTGPRPGNSSYISYRSEQPDVVLYETGTAQSFSNPPANKWRVLSISSLLFANGMNDAAAGALIPYLQTQYHTDYAVTSLIFVASAAGFLISGLLADTINKRLGHARTLVIAQILIIAEYVILQPQPPFGVVVFSFFVGGLGLALNVALGLVYLSNLADAASLLGYCTGAYGVGGTVGPLIATVLVSHGVNWSRFYAITIGLAGLNAAFVARAFSSHGDDAHLRRTASGSSISRGRTILQSLRNRNTLLGAIFVFTYQGAEVSISAWNLSYLIKYRHGDPRSVGYTTAGFWAGVTIGRLALTRFSPRVGDKLFTFVATGGAIVFELLAWLIPNVIGDAVAICLVGLLIGPVSPAATAVFAKLLPREVQLTSLALISGMGSSGGALWPFVTGVLAQVVGTWVVHAVAIFLFLCMLVAWLLLPKVERREQ